MKIKVALFIIFCAMCTYGYSQVLTSSILVKKDVNEKTETIYLNWDLGESFIDTLILKKGRNEVDTFNIKIVSNPVNDLLKILIADTKGSQLDFVLFDINGRSLRKAKAYDKNTSVDIEVSDLSGGLYILKIINNNGDIIKNYKILKN